MAAKLWTSQERIVTFILILLSTFAMNETLINRCRCKKKTKEAHKTFRSFNPLTSACLSCNTTANPKSLQWIFIPKEHNDTSLPENICINQEAHFLTLQRYRTSQYVNGGIYKYINKDNDTVLCSFKVSVQENYSWSKTLSETRETCIEGMYVEPVSSYRWFYRKTWSPSDQFRELVSKDESKLLTSPCKMTLAGNKICLHDTELSCQGYYKVIMYSGKGNYFITELINATTNPAPKMLSMTCLNKNTFYVQPHDNITINCSGTVPVRSEPRLSFLCRAKDGSIQLNKSFTLRSSDITTKDMHHFYFGYTKLKSDIDEDFNIFLTIKNFSQADDNLTCNLTLRNKSKVFLYKLVMANESTRVLLVATIACVLSLVLIFALFSRIELEVVFLLRHLIARLRKNAVEEYLRTKPWLVVLHGPNTNEMAASVIQAIESRLPKVIL